MIMSAVFAYTGKGQKVPKDVVSVRFHPSVVEVDNHAFEYCWKLKEVVLNEGLQKIGKNAFESCSSLQSITLPSSLTKIGLEAFQNCGNLKKVELHKGLQTIGEYAFSRCTSLVSITLPSTLIVVQKGAFYGCYTLREVAMNGNIEVIGSNAFSSCPLLEITFPRISTRLNNIIQTGHYPRVETKIDEVRGAIEREGCELFIFAETETMGRRGNWKAAKESIEQIVNSISYYEIEEAMALFKLALWKSNLDQAEEANDMNRDVYRIEVPGPVKDTILQYLLQLK